jgi:hypothetical protein
MWQNAWIVLPKWRPWWTKGSVRPLSSRGVCTGADQISDMMPLAFSHSDRDLSPKILAAFVPEPLHENLKFGGVERMCRDRRADLSSP